jgi:Tol biopolymer transport system component
MFNTDGSQLQLIATPNLTNLPFWAPAGNEVLFQAWPADLMVTDLSGRLRVATNPALRSGWVLGAQYSRDGSAIFLAYAPSSNNYRLWRVGSDGNGLTELTGTLPDTVSFPSPSPSGDAVAYIARHDAGNRLSVITLPSGPRRTLNPTAAFARWSPVDDQIAYLDGGALWVIRSDGTGQRRVSPASVYEGAFDWSPDGKWLVAPTSGTQLHLLEVATGLTLPLAFSIGSGAASWRQH